jgi:hypothetical protein
MTVLFRCATIALLAMACPVQAAENDMQVWTVAQANISLGERTVLLADVHYRYADDASRLGQNQLRAALGYRLNRNTILAQGYVYVRTDPGAGPITHEHRPFQQLNFRLAGNGAGPTLMGRARLEERFVEGSGDMGVRVRQQLRGTVPLGAGVYALATVEVMVNLNSADWGQRRGFDQSRAMAGLGLNVAKRTQIEAGYMHNYVARYQRPDRINHNVSLALSFTG